MFKKRKQVDKTRSGITVGGEEVYGWRGKTTWG